MKSHLTRRNFCATASALALATWKPNAFARALPTTATYTNPVLPGNHPDASPIRVGSDFYITHSSFLYAPGLIVWRSRDLVHWTPVSSALPRYIGNVYAPYLCEHRKHFYIYFPVDGQLFVVHAEAPSGPWSDPIDLHVKGIDPCHFASADGRRLLYFAGGQMIELTPDGLAVEGSPRTVYKPWPIPDAWRIQCECLEAPKVTQKDGYIYLTVAEGGTSGPPTSHMVISMRSRDPEGPWEFSPYNPILHTTSRDQFWWSVGHGRLVDAPDGSWWMTCHAYENGYRTLGRQNLLVPVDWTSDGWYRVSADISRNAPLPAPPGFQRDSVLAPPDFSGDSLSLQWQFFKAYDRSRYSLHANTLTLQPDGTDPAHTSMLTCMARDHSYTVEVKLEIAEGGRAGLLLFYSDEHSVGLELTNEGLRFLRNGAVRNLNAHTRRITLRLVNEEQEVDAYYRLPGEPWKHVHFAVEVTDFDDNILGHYLDLRPALFACGSAASTFRSFSYQRGALDPRIHSTTP